MNTNLRFDTKGKELLKILKDNRKDLAESSIKMYSNCLNKLYQTYCKSSKSFKPDSVDLKFLQNTKRVLALVNQETLTTKKARLTCIVVFLKAIKAKDSLIKTYTDEMIKSAEEYQAWLKTQKKSETQKKNWIEQNDLDDILNNLFKEIKEFKQKDELTKDEYNKLQVYTLLRLLDKYSIRNEFGSMVFINKSDYDKLKDATTNGVRPAVGGKENYMITDGGKMTIVLNKYKTAKYLGEQKYDVDKALIPILKILFKFNKSGFVFTKSDRKTQIGSNGITKLLTNYFMKTTGKSISTSMLRHIQATNDQEGDDTIMEEEKKDAEIKKKYLHNEAQHKLYRKID